MTDAEKREKVIRGLEACNRQSYNGSDCQNCPYYDDEDTAELPFGICNIQDMFDDALALLREQEPRVLTVEELKTVKDQTDVWLDEPDCMVVAATISNWVEQKNHAVTFFYGIKHTAFEERDYMNNNYNRTWRCWSARPSPEQMRDTPWEGEDNG